MTRLPQPKRLALSSACLLTCLAICLAIATATWATFKLKHSTDPTQVQPILIPDHIALENGDIILAGGISLQSRLIRSLTQDNTYSHIGLIETTSNGYYVLHAAPKGAGDGGAGDYVARIPLSVFLSQRGYTNLQIMRLKEDESIHQSLKQSLRQSTDQPSSQFTSPLTCESIAQTAYEHAAAYVEKQIPFDHAFDLTDHNRLYCSELIYLAYQEAGYTWPSSLITHHSNLMLDGPAILPTSFTQCLEFQTVWQYASQDLNQPK